MLLGINSQVNEEIGYAFFPGALVMETRKSAGMFFDHAGGSVGNGGQISLDEAPAGILNGTVAHLVLDRIDQLHVAD